MNAPSVMAVCETTNFTFYAFGRSRDEALAMLRAKWQTHKKRTGATWEWAELIDSVYVAGIQAGAFERSELPEPPRFRKTRVNGYVHLIPID